MKSRSATNLLLRRLANQHVTGAPMIKPEDVVAHLGAVQSQDYLGAKWSLGQRVKGATDATIDAAFNDGRIIRIHVMRPTWHFVTPGNIRWMLKLTGPRVQAGNRHMERKLELDAKTLRRTCLRIENALSGGRSLTRSEIATDLERVRITARSQRLAYIMMHAELTGLVCSGPLKRKQHTYMLLEERVPQYRELSRDESLGQLALMFFTGHAPATLKHFAWWSGLTARDANAGLAMVENRLVPEKIGSLTFWSGSARKSSRRDQGGAHLIPEYDECLTGWRDLGVQDIEDPRATGWSDNFFRPVIVGGKRAGTWRRRFNGDKVVIDTNLFAQPGKSERAAIERAAAMYESFIGRPVTIEM